MLQIDLDPLFQRFTANFKNHVIDFEVNHVIRCCIVKVHYRNMSDVEENSVISQEISDFASFKFTFPVYIYQYIDSL